MAEQLEALKAQLEQKNAQLDQKTEELALLRTAAGQDTSPQMSHGHGQTQSYTQVGRAEQLNYSMDAYVADQDDDEYAPTLPGLSPHEKRVDPSTNKDTGTTRPPGKARGIRRRAGPSHRVLRIHQTNPPISPAKSGSETMRPRRSPALARRRSSTAKPRAIATIPRATATRTRAMVTNGKQAYPRIKLISSHITLAPPQRARRMAPLVG